MTLVKICGLMEADSAVAVAKAGADFIGMIFATSKRQIGPEQAQAIVSAVKRDVGAFKSLNGFPREGLGNLTRHKAFYRRIEERLQTARPAVVGVFVNEAPEKVNQVADFCGLDFVQLNGDESWEYCREINRPVIKALRVSGETAEEVLNYFGQGLETLADRGFLYLLDAHVQGSYGGTGTTFDWGIAREIAREFPFIMAGGMTPVNVGQALMTVEPWAVDVSTGVETNGAKDINKIIAFIEVVRGVQWRRKRQG